MSDSAGNEKIRIYSGKHNPNTLKYNKQLLESGKIYGFSVIAYNFNGAGAESTVSYYKPCSIPANLATPEVIKTTKSQLILQWVPPEDDGACPITGYILYFDEGDTSSEFAPIDVD